MLTIGGQRELFHVPGHIGCQHLNLTRTQIQVMQTDELGTQIRREVNAGAIRVVARHPDGHSKIFVKQRPPDAGRQIHLIKPRFIDGQIAADQQTLIVRRKIQRRKGARLLLERHGDGAVIEPLNMHIPTSTVTFGGVVGEGIPTARPDHAAVAGAAIGEQAVGGTGPIEVEKLIELRSSGVLRVKESVLIGRRGVDAEDGLVEESDLLARTHGLLQAMYLAGL
jgi:hypothetical protein